MITRGKSIRFAAQDYRLVETDSPTAVAQGLLWQYKLLSAFRPVDRIVLLLRMILFILRTCNHFRAMIFGPEQAEDNAQAVAWDFPFRGARSKWNQFHPVFSYSALRYSYSYSIGSN